MTHTGEKTQRTGREVRIPNPCAVSFTMGLLSYLSHEIPHGLGGFVLLLAGSVGVGPQSEPVVVVPQHGGHHLDVYAVLEGQGGKGVPEIVEPEVLQPSIFQNALVEGSHRVWMVHVSGAGGGEETGIVRVLGASFYEKLHRLLGNGD